MKGLDYLYGRRKPIEMNETPYYPFQYRTGDAVAAARVEAREFIVGGRSKLQSFEFSLHCRRPGRENARQRPGSRCVRNLKNSVYSLDFVKMHADKSFVLSGIPAHAYCRGISQPIPWSRADTPRRSR